MTPEQLWHEFVAKYPSYEGKPYDVFTFGDKPDELLQLVLQGEKTATSCIYRGGELAQAGDISIILDSKGNAEAIIQTTSVSIVPFNQVTEEFARKEGEGDKTLATWRKIHEAFWKDIKPDTLLECEEFRLLYQNIELDIHETTDNDLQNIQKLWNNGEVMYWVGFPKGLHKTILQLQNWLKKLPEHGAKHYSIYEKHLGYCGETFYKIDGDTAIVDIKLLPNVQGRGIGQKSLQFTIDEVFRLGAQQAFVDPFKTNKKSIHLYKKLGFKQKRHMRQTTSNLVLPCDYTIEMILNKK